MEEEKIAGITLQSIPYLGNGRIIRFFTPKGMISLFKKRIFGKKPEDRALSSPFSHLEVVYRKGKSDLFLIKDLTLLDLFLEIRETYGHVQAAAGMAKALLKTQLPGKEAPLLFALFQSYLKKLPAFLEPEVLESSFYCKLLHHEGLLDLTSSCSSCKAPATHLSEGESHCALHAKPGATALSPKDFENLLLLSHGKTFSTLKLASPSKIASDLFSRLIP